MINKKNLQIYIDILIVLVIIVVIFIQTININVPSLETDEYGYLGSAAFFAGFNWSKHISRSNGYFSYVYGLIISPLLRLISDSFFAFRCMQVLNIIVLIINYYILQKIIIFLKLPVNIFQKKLFALIATLYCSNVIFCRCVLPECFLVMLFNLNIYFIYKLCKKKSVIYCILLSFSSLILCFMHQRAISIVVAVGVTLILVKISQKNSISIKEIAFFLVVIVVGLIIYNIGKDFVIQKVWINSKATEWQSYSTQVKNLSFITSIRGWYKFICSLFGKFFYLLVSTQFMLLYFLKNCYTRIVIFYKNNNYNNLFYLYLFMIFALFFTLGITCVFTSNPTGSTYLFYGRYNEYIIGVYIIVGLCEFLNSRCWKFDMICVVVFIVISMLCKGFIISENVKDGNCSILTPAITYFYNTENNFDIELCTLVTIVVFVLFILIRESKYVKWKALVGVILLCINIWTSFCAFNDFFIEDKIKINNAVSTMAKTIQDVGDESKVCVVVTDDKKMTGTYVKTVQFILKDIEIDSCNNEEIKQIYDRYDFIITFDILWIPESKLSLVYSEEGISMYSNRKGEVFGRYN